MKIIVLDPEKKPEGGWNHTNRRHVYALYAYSFMFDPFILGQAGTVPLLLKEDEIDNLEKTGLLVCPYRQSDSHLTGVFQNIEKNGGGLILVQPHADTFESLNSLKGVTLKAELFSTKERWVFKLKRAKEHFYPAQHFGMRLKYQVIENQGSEIYAWVGGIPEFFVKGKVAVFPTDILFAHILFLNGDTFDFTVDISTQFVRGARRVSGLDFPEEMESAMYDKSDLRRDFHSFGFAYSMVRELAQELEAEDKINFSQTDRLIVQAAKSTLNNGESKARHYLKSAFQALEKISWQLAPIKKYILNSYHGGVLFDDVGYAEYDWPQHSADLFNNWINLVKNKNYRFILEVEAHTLENFAQRYPEVWKDITNLWKSGLIEIGNGTYSQPYPQYYPLESNIHQFENGLITLERLCGMKPTVYVGQEFGFTPQLPQILRGFGYRNAVHMTQNNGDVPILKEEKVLWQGKDGSIIEALPAQTPRSEKKCGNMYFNLAVLIAGAFKDGYKFGAFTCLLDQTLYAYFREETIRTASYAPVLGEFKTFSGFFSLTGKPNVRKQFVMDDYQVTYFLPVEDAFAWHKVHTGNYLTNYMNAVKAENIILSGESLNAVTAAITKGKSVKDYVKHWQFLNQYENHDSMIVGGLCPGDFFNAFVQNYHGRREPLPIRDRAKRDLDWAIEDVLKQRLENLRELSKFVKSSTDGFLIYNPLNCERKAIISLPGNLKTEVRLPSLGYRVLSFRNVNTSYKGGVKVSKDFLENESIRLEIDEKTGSLKGILDKKSHEEFLSGLGNQLVLGPDSRMVCKKIKVTEESPLTGTITIYGNILDGRKNIAGFETSVSLETNSRIISFKTKLTILSPIKGEQWANSIRTVFSTKLKAGKVMRNYFNVCEETKKDRFFSLYFVSLKEKKKTFDMYNKGNQYYLYKDGKIENLMVYGNEGMREFEYGVGINVIHPLNASLCWQVETPFLMIEKNDRGILPEEMAFIKVDRPNVLVSSLKHKYGKITVRVMETEGIDSEVELFMCFDISSASETDYLGNKRKRLIVKDKTTRFRLKAWEVRQIVFE